MDSVKPSEVANSFESYYKHELDREREDDENIKFYDERVVHGIAGSLEEILGEDIILENIMGFLKAINLFYDI